MKFERRWSRKRGESVADICFEWIPELSNFRFRMS